MKRGVAGLGALAAIGAAFACDSELVNRVLPEVLRPDAADAGVAWKVFQPDPAVPNWRGVWAARHDLVWVVGDNGAIMKWDGQNWTRVASGTTANLESIWGRAADDIFVVGHGGVVLHSSGGDFSPVTVPGRDGGMVNPSRRNLFTVFGDRQYVYMAGESGEILTQDPDGGIRSMYQEATLTTFPICETRVNNVTEPAAVCTTQLVPRDSADGGIIFGPDRYPTCGAPPECCVFDGGGGNFCCYPQRCDPDGGPLEGRVGVDSDLKAGWAEGDYAVLCGAGGSIFEFIDGPQGRKWYENELAPGTPYTRDNLAAAWGTSAGNVYCAGQDGRLMRKRNGTWNSSSIPTPVFVQSMWGTGSQDIYAVGFSGVLLRFDGRGTTRDAGWYDEDIRVPEHLRGVTGVRLDYDGGQVRPDGGHPPARVFVVGSGGKVLIKN